MLSRVTHTLDVEKTQHSELSETDVAKENSVRVSTMQISSRDNTTSNSIREMSHGNTPSVPHNVADLAPESRKIAMDWLVVNGYIVGGAYDNECNAIQRTEAGWDGKSLSLTLFSGNKKGQRGAWFPPNAWPTFFKYYAWDLQHVFDTPLFFIKLWERKSRFVWHSTWTLTDQTSNPTTH
jgi:hypothetical protein